MYDNSKSLSQNQLKESSYYGKDVGIIKNHIFFNSFKIENDMIICSDIVENQPSEVQFKLANIFNYCVALADSKSLSDLEKCINLFSKIGVPKTLSLDISNKYIKLDPLDIDTTDVSIILNKMKIISSLANNNLAEVSKNRLLSSFQLSFALKTNPTLLTELIPVPISSSIFSLAYYYYMRITPLSLDKFFICSECGNIDKKTSNSIRFCKSCRKKIDFPKISRSKK